MKLTTSPTPEDLTNLAQDVIVEILSGLVKGVKISVDHGIYIYNKRPGEETISQIYYSRKQFFEIEYTQVLNIIQLGLSDGAKVISNALGESGGKFTRFQ